MLIIRLSILFILLGNILYAQNVGIGTNAPTNKLEVNSAQKGNSGLKLTQLANANLKSNYFTNEITDSLLSINDFVFDELDNMLVCDLTNRCINAINTNGVVSKKFNYIFNIPISICKDPLNNYYVLDQYVVFKIAAGSNALTTYATLNSGDYYDHLLFTNNALFVSKNYVQIQKINSNGTFTTFTNFSGLNIVDMVNDNAGNIFAATSVGSIYKINNVGISTVFFTSSGLSDCRAIAIGLNNELYYSTTYKLYTISNTGIENEYFTSNITINLLGCNNYGELYGKPSGYELIIKVQPVSNSFLSIDKSGNLIQVKNPDKISNNQMYVNIPLNARNMNADVVKGSYIEGTNITANTLTVGGIVGHNSTRIQGLYTSVANIGPSNNIQKKVFGIALPYSLPSTNYTVQVTVLQEGNFLDVFTASVTNITPSGFDIVVYRIDGNGWGQNLRVAYTVLEL